MSIKIDKYIEPTKPIKDIFDTNVIYRTFISHNKKYVLHTKLITHPTIIDLADNITYLAGYKFYQDSRISCGTDFYSEAYITLLEENYSENRGNLKINLSLVGEKISHFSWGIDDTYVIYTAYFKEDNSSYLVMQKIQQTYPINPINPIIIKDFPLMMLDHHPYSICSTDSIGVPKDVKHPIGSTDSIGSTKHKICLKISSFKKIESRTIEPIEFVNHLDQKIAQRSYPGLLKNEDDDKNFLNYLSAKLVLIEISKYESNQSDQSTWDFHSTTLTDTIPIKSYSMSYTGKNLIYKEYTKLSHIVNHSNFGYNLCIISLENNFQKVKLFEIPVHDKILPLMDACENGPRDFEWIIINENDYLLWAEALDNGNPKEKVNERDRVMIKKIDFTVNTEPVEIFKCQYRFGECYLDTTDNFWVSEAWNKDKVVRLSRSVNGSSEEIFKFDEDDLYGRPGTPMTIVDDFDCPKIFLPYSDPNWIIVKKDGHSPKGVFPSVSLYHLKTHETKIIWKCTEPVGCFISSGTSIKSVEPIGCETSSGTPIKSVEPVGSVKISSVEPKTKIYQVPRRIFKIHPEYLTILFTEESPVRSQIHYLYHHYLGEEKNEVTDLIGIPKDVVTRPTGSTDWIGVPEDVKHPTGSTDWIGVPEDVKHPTGSTDWIGVPEDVKHPTGSTDWIGVPEDVKHPTGSTDWIGVPEDVKHPTGSTDWIGVPEDVKHPTGSTDWIGVPKDVKHPTGSTDWIGVPKDVKHPTGSTDWIGVPKDVKHPIGSTDWIGVPEDVSHPIGSTDWIGVPEDVSHPIGSTAYSFIKQNSPIIDHSITYSGLKDYQKESIKYTRTDGIPLSATLYLPSGYVPGEKRKIFIWAYPQEYNNIKDVGQIRSSPNEFARIHWGSPLFWLAKGYIVVNDCDMPIIKKQQTDIQIMNHLNQTVAERNLLSKGNLEKQNIDEIKEPNLDLNLEANDTFVDQLKMNAEAIINYLKHRGMTDGTKIAIGGHSYGAAMVANLLVHTNLFTTGIARSGAYNRTLTAFGFQNEERNLWSAKKVYFDMSPFLYADEIKSPILLIHGQSDTNPGTFPLQSERFYEALRGLGKEVKLVMLPYEGHSYESRESILHMLGTMEKWLDQWM